MNTRRRPLTLPFAVLLTLAVLAACSPDPQEKYDNATEALQQAREARNDAQDKVKDKKDELAELQANLNEAQAKLEAARKKVQQASQHVDKTVTDEVLFRTLQREVLGEDKFDDAAISVGVNNRVVTLTGNVPDDKTHKAAIKAAKAQPGVKSVVDNLEVKQSKQAPAENGAQKSGGSSGGGQDGSGES